MTVTMEHVPGQVLDRQYRRPVIAIVGGGDAVVLNGVGSEWTLKPGSTGLGLAPVEHATAPLPGGGAIIQSTRSKEREVFLPVDVHLGYGPDAYGKLEDARRRIEAIVAGDVELRLLGKDGYRSVFGRYASGLEGSFAREDVNGWRMNLALKFLIPDPWWYGGQRQREWSLSRLQKPYWTSYPRLPHYPAWLAPSTVTGAFEFTVYGDAPAAPVWTIYPPGKDLLIECHNGCGARLFFKGKIDKPVTLDALAEDITAEGFDRGELWSRLSDDSRFFTLPPGENQVKVSMVETSLNSKIELAYRERYRAGH